MWGKKHSWGGQWICGVLWILGGVSSIWAQQEAIKDARQVISADSAKDPYDMTGEALVGLCSEMIDFSDDQTSIMFHRQSGKLFVKHTRKAHQEVENILKQLRDRQEKQVIIEARIIEVDYFQGQDMGGFIQGLGFNKNQKSIQLSSPLSNGSWGKGVSLNPNEELNIGVTGKGSLFNLDLGLRALEQDGKVHTLSAPRIICYNNQRANIRIETSTDYIARLDTSTVVSTASTNTNLSTDIETAVEGIVLDVTPVIHKDDSIRLDIHPEVVELISLDVVDLGEGKEIRTPKYVRRTADTTVTLKNGGTIVIGGLMKRSTDKNVQDIPGISKIPILGRLFKRETEHEYKSNLLIFLTAKIWEPGDEFN